MRVLQVQSHFFILRHTPMQRVPCLYRSPRLGCKAEDGPGKVMVLCARRGDQRSWERASTLDRRGSVLDSTTLRRPSTINRPEMKIEADAPFYKPDHEDSSPQSLNMSEEQSIKLSARWLAVSSATVRKTLLSTHSHTLFEC